MPLKTVQDMQIQEYQDLFKDFFIFKRKNGILEVRMHTNNKEAKWSKEIHRALPQIFTIIGAIIIVASGVFIFRYSYK